MMIKISLNGKEVMIAEGMSVLDFLKSIGLDVEKVLIQLNRTLLSKGGYASTVLKDADRLHTIRIMGGG